MTQVTRRKFIKTAGVGSHLDALDGRAAVADLREHLAAGERELHRARRDRRKSRVCGSWK